MQKQCYFKILLYCILSLLEAIISLFKPESYCRPEGL